MKLTINSSNPRIRQKKGFALILTLALISFVFLLVITLVNQVRTEFSFTESRKNQILAKAHARMGMMIAIGEVQKHLGPDMRVSATADIYDERISYAEDNSNVDLYENGEIQSLPAGQRMWTGVWKNRGGWAETKLATRPLPENRDDGKALTLSWSYDSSYDPHPAIETAWLVSGNEGWKKKLAVLSGNNIVREFVEVPDGIIIDDEGNRVLNQPTGGTYGQKDAPWVDHSLVVGEINASNNYHHPLLAIADNDQKAWLLKYPVLHKDFDPENSTHQENWEEYLVGEPVAVPKTAIHEAEISNSDLAQNESMAWNDRKGSYAYWVADEGVKAKINILPPSLSNETKLKVASSPHIGEGSFGIILSAQDEKRRKDLISVESLGSLLDINVSDSKNGFFHSMTANSFGVLTDVRTGGLKRDLSQAFALNQETSEAWRKDFESNFIFRDRLRAMKNIPLDPNVKRNQWFVSANDATVDDAEALLAGPPWSVLADFHNLNTTNDTLVMEPPDQFPRTVGDNALIFGRMAPASPRNAFSGASSAYPYYNCFSSSIRRIRPEPKNHPIQPVFVKARLSISPVATSNPGNFCLGINPAITLWNPYNKSMELEDIFIEIPFAGESGAYEPFECKVTQVDFREYDLYRKWWAYIYGDFNASFELKDSDIDPLYRPYYSGYIKNWKEPWGIFNFRSGTNAFNEPQSEESLIDKFLLGEGGFKPQLGIDLSNWNNRVPPDSMLGMKLEGNVFYHENPREGFGDFTFIFHSMEKKQIAFERLILKITNENGSSGSVTLEPGEVVTFAAYASANPTDVQSNQPVVGQNPEPPEIIEVTKKPSGKVEKGYVWDSGFALDKDACAFIIKMGGVAGYRTMTAEKFDPRGILDDAGWKDKDDYIEPKCFTLWNGSPDLDSSKALCRITEPKTVIPDYGYDVKYSTNNYLKLSLEETDTGDYGDKLFGLGWEVSLKMPGDSDNERIPLVEFNTRALVHSTQHGQGNWLGDARVLKPSHYGSPPQLKFSPQPNPISYDIDDTRFVFNSTSDGYSPSYPKSTPDIYGLPATRPDGPIPSINNIKDPDSRASILGFSIKPTNYDFEDGDNPDFSNTPKVASAWGQEKIGFFTENTATTLSPYNGQFSDSSHAVLFDVPEGKVLSLFQYRHANLNNYVHGPSYALGNSYASTQVARHRSWGRVQNIVKRPTSEGGLTNVRRNMEDEEDAINFYKKMLGAELANLKGLGNFINWDIDKDGGFAPWRDWGADQLNHQNTTIDHSYYLNASLCDGFFLTGSTSSIDYVKEENAGSGQLYSPYLWQGSNGAIIQSNEDLNVTGNHRLVAYFRDHSWETGQTSYGGKSKEKRYSVSKDSDYRFQTTSGDLLVNGAFNINSTSIDAWVAQLSSLRGLAIENANVRPNETPIIRFINEPEQTGNEWNKLRVLTDEEIKSLASEMVKQVKLRGPFLSFSDFVNRRLALGPMDSDPSKAKGTRINFVQYDLNEWNDYQEDRYTAQGLRGAVQSAIMASGLNDPYKIENGQLKYNLQYNGNKIVHDSAGGVSSDGWDPLKGNYLPEIPDKRYSADRFNDSIFGLHASSRMNELSPNTDLTRSWGVGSSTQLLQVNVGDVNGDGKIESIHDDLVSYPNTNYGEAPENLLAVEHLATAANKPGWVMQSDLLSPLIPVTSARSDTFMIRVQGDTNSKSPANAWIELVVQRTPDYVKSDLDSPHHRPHEPFKDINLNGYWDNGVGEHWIDLNQNADVFDQPDLAGVGELGKQKDYRDGLLSDLKLNMDPQEEDSASQSQISYLGTNQRFGRKFKIVSFRWLRANEV